MTKTTHRGDPVNAPTISRQSFRNLISKKYPKAFDVIVRTASAATQKRPATYDLQSNSEIAEADMLNVVASHAMRRELEQHLNLRTIQIAGAPGNLTLICVRGELPAQNRYSASLPRISLDALHRQFPHGMQVMQTLAGELGSGRLYASFTPKPEMQQELRELQCLIANGSALALIEDEYKITLGYRDPKGFAARHAHSSPPEWNLFVSLQLQAQSLL